MSQFIYFTPEEKARAQNTNLVSLLRAQGERPVRSGREFRPPNDPSITVRGNKWFDHSARVGGYAVSFVQRYYRLPYQEAVLLLLGRKNNKSYEQAKPAKETPKPFALPEPYGTMRRIPHHHPRCLRTVRKRRDILPRQMGQASGDADGKGKHPV